MSSIIDTNAQPTVTAMANGTSCGQSCARRYRIAARGGTRLPQA
ncbi:hypothetical protein ACQUSY_03775 [Microbacterium sp. YY-03]